MNGSDDFNGVGCALYAGLRTHLDELILEVLAALQNKQSKDIPSHEHSHYQGWVHESLALCLSTCMLHGNASSDIHVRKLLWSLTHNM